jgi:hypothetical protein
MIRTTFFAASLLLASAAFAEEAGDPMAFNFGNTITIDIPAVFYKAIQFTDPDHKWRRIEDGRIAARGVWAVKAGVACFTQTDPKPAPQDKPICNPTIEHQIGDTWINVDPNTGNTVLLGLVAGRDSAAGALK